MYSKYASSSTNRILEFSFFLKIIRSLFDKYVPVGLFGFAKKTIFVFLFTFLIISFIDALKFISFEYIIFAPAIFA